MLRKPFFIILFILAVTVLHYLTPTHAHHLHEVYKVLYFIPIILAGFAFGFRGGFTASLVVTVLYLPHVMFQWGGSLLMNLSRFLMIVLYIVLGSLTGYLSQREKEERKKYQRVSIELEKSLQKLQKSSEEMLSLENQLISAERLSTLGELTASLAHEVRNPLGSIRGVAEILRDESDAHKKFVNILLKETDRLDQVVAHYLEFAKPREKDMQPIPFSALVESVVTLLGPELRKKEIFIDMDINPPELRLLCLENQIRQVLLNILLNAVQYSPVKGSIRIAAAIDSKSINITISDHGPGFIDLESKNIFDPFVSYKENGTGLGLAISKRIVDIHNGKIVAVNAPDGAQIRMEFPVS